MHEKRLDSIDTMCARFNGMGPTVRQHTEKIKHNKDPMITFVDEMTEIIRKMNVNKEVTNHVAGVCRVNKDKIVALHEKYQGLEQRFEENRLDMENIARRGQAQGNPIITQIKYEMRILKAGVGDKPARFIKKFFDCLKAINATNHNFKHVINQAL